MNISSKLMLAATALSGSFSLTSCASKAAEATGDAQHPNLLYIFPDQYRLHALGLWSNPEYRNVLSTIGDPVQTPNLDKLAKEGIVFTQACSMFPLSSPHRGMMMSGMYSTRNGLDTNAHKSRTAGLRNDITCFTDVLAEAGYETAYIGKTHWERNEALFDKDLNYVGTTEAPGGHFLNAYDTYIPEGRGRHSNKFWFQQLNGIHFNASRYSNRPEYVNGNKDGQPYVEHAFATTTEANIIIDYLNNKGDNMRDESKPFSIIWSINPPHNPYSKISDCEPEEYKLFADMDFDQLLVRKNVEMLGEKERAQLELTSKVYYALIKSVDREIGRVLETLKENGLEENTIVAFTSDHGEMMGSHGKMGKPQIYDEAYLVPFLIKYPGKIEHRLDDLRLNSIDIMPTILSMMGLGDMIPETVDGRDYSQGILTGNYGEAGKPASSLYRDFASKGVRNDKYTYLVTPEGDYSLYDLHADPYQMTSLKLEDIAPADVETLKTQLGEWLYDAGDAWVADKKNSNLINY